MNKLFSVDENWSQPKNSAKIMKNSPLLQLDGKQLDFMRSARQTWRIILRLVKNSLILLFCVSTTQ